MWDLNSSKKILSVGYKMKSPFRLRVEKNELYILLYFFAFIVHYFTNLNFNITYMIWVAVGCFGFLIFWYNYPWHRNHLNILFLIDVIASVGIIINRGHSAFNVLMLPASQMFGFALYEYRYKLEHLAKFVYILGIYILGYAIVTPKTLVNVSQGQYSTQFSNLVGGNTISIFLIFLLTIDLIYREYSNKKINYVNFIVALLIAAWCGGNGGVLTLTVFLIGIITLRWDSKRISKIKVLVLAVLGLLIIFLFEYQYRIIQFVTDDNSRFWMWTQYYLCATSSAKDFIFGADVSRVLFLANQKNTHNTFINWHYYYGMIPFIYYLKMVALSFFKAIKKQNYIILLILGVMILRAMTDEASFCFIPLWTYASLILNNNEEKYGVKVNV